ncbi:MAG: hypothetical protein HY720_32335 [Planctomycetes bacterium]|nr:hypothetical protein [Planctomycetota bacterium]
MKKSAAVFLSILFWAPALAAQQEIPGPPPDTGDISPESPAPAEQDLPEAIRSWDFSHEPEADDDRDNFPDDWERILNRPSFLPYNFVKLRPEGKEHPDAERMAGRPWPTEDGVWMYIRRGNVGIRLGADQVVPADLLNRYRVRARVKTEGLANGFAYLSTHVYDAEGRLATRGDSETIRGDTPWRDIEAVVTRIPDGGGRIVVELLAIGAGDIGASAWFDDVALYEEPIFQLDTEAENEKRAPLFFGPGSPRIQIHTSGLAAGKLTRECEVVPERGPGSFVSTASLDVTLPNGGKGWTEDVLELPIDTPGLYRCRYRLLREGKLAAATEFRFAILGTLSSGAASGKIGAALDPTPEGIQPSIARARELGSSWALVPLPIGGDSAPEAADEPRIAAEIAGLPASGVTTVASLGPFARMGPDGHRGWIPANAASFFGRGRSAWLSDVESVLLANRTIFSEWLLAPPGDLSLGEPGFVDGELPELVAVVRETAPWLALGLPVSPDRVMEPGWSPPPGIDFLLLSANGPEDAEILPTAVEVAARFERAGGGTMPVDVAVRVPRGGPEESSAGLDKIVPLWLSLLRSPVRRILLDPAVTSDSSWGALSPGGGPTRLFLAARTVNRTLAGASYRGKLPIEPAFPNFLFRGGEGKTIGAIWRNPGPGPGAVEIYVGGSPAALSFDGTPVELVTDRNRTRVDAGEEPILITNINTELVETLLSIALSDSTLAATGTPQRRTLSLANRFAGRKDLQFRIRLAPDWETDQIGWRAELKPGKSGNFPFEVELPRDVSLGTARAWVEGVVLGADPLPFRAYLPFTVESTIEIVLSYGPPWLVVKLVNHGTTSISAWAFAHVPGFLPSQDSRLLKLPATPPGGASLAVGMEGDGEEEDEKGAARFYLPESPDLEGKTLRVGVRQYAGSSAFDQSFVFGKQKQPDGTWAWTFTPE